LYELLKCGFINFLVYFCAHIAMAPVLFTSRSPVAAVTFGHATQARSRIARTGV